MIDENNFLSKDKFSEIIERKVLEDDISYFDAVIEFAAESDRSPEELMPFMSTVILDKVRKSAMDAGMINTNDQTDLDEFLD